MYLRYLRRGMAICQFVPWFLVWKVESRYFDYLRVAGHASNGQRYKIIPKFILSYYPSKQMNKYWQMYAIAIIIIMVLNLTLNNIFVLNLMVSFVEIYYTHLRLLKQNKIYEGCFECL